MGEAKRAKAKGFRIKGPYSYEIGVYRVSDVLARTALAIRRNEPASQQANDVLRAILELGRRMLDPQHKTMLCMTCDYEFSRGERPVEVAIGLPFATRDNPMITSPICPACAALDPESKHALIVAHWRKLDPHGEVQEPGNA